MPTPRTITTPKGKRMTDRQYCALRSAQSYNGRADAPDCACEHGHFGCAVWEGGPCFDEVHGRAYPDGGPA